MRLEFSETVPVAPDVVYGYFRTPGDWSRLYRAFGQARDRGGGWFAVPLRRSPLALVVRITRDQPCERVSWEFRGLFRGTGEVRLRPAGTGTLIEGYEDVGIPRAFGLGRLIERLFMESRFRRIWASGWRRLRAPA